MMEAVLPSETLARGQKLPSATVLNSVDIFVASFSGGLITHVWRRRRCEEGLEIIWTE